MCDPRDSRKAGNSFYGDALSQHDFSIGSNDVTTGLASEFSSLPPLNRVQRYLVMAGYARREASSNDAAVRESYLFVAEQWEKLALDLALHTARRLQTDMPSTPALEATKPIAGHGG